MPLKSPVTLRLVTLFLSNVSMKYLDDVEFDNGVEMRSDGITSFSKGVFGNFNSLQTLNVPGFRKLM